MVAEVQKRGGIEGLIDAEHALDPVYAKNLGVDVNNLYISQPLSLIHILYMISAVKCRKMTKKTAVMPMKTL